MKTIFKVKKRRILIIVTSILFVAIYLTLIFRENDLQIRCFIENEVVFQIVADRILESDVDLPITKDNYERKDDNLNTIFLKSGVRRIYKDYPILGAVSFEIDASWDNYYGIVYLPMGGEKFKKTGAFDMKNLNDDKWYIISK